MSVPLLCRVHCEYIVAYAGVFSSTLDCLTFYIVFYISSLADMFFHMFSISSLILSNCHALKQSHTLIKFEKQNSNSDCLNYHKCFSGPRDPSHEADGAAHPAHGHRVYLEAALHVRGQVALILGQCCCQAAQGQDAVALHHRAVPGHTGGGGGLLSGLRLRYGSTSTQRRDHADASTPSWTCFGSASGFSVRKVFYFIKIK